jgi:hypothetical protein
MIKKSELQQVPVEQRVPGRIYGVADNLNGLISRFKIFVKESKDSEGLSWNYWFDLPMSMFHIKDVMMIPKIQQEYEFSNNDISWYKGKLTGFFTETGYWAKIRPIQTMPELTVPSGTKQEQIMRLESLLRELKK